MPHINSISTTMRLVSKVLRLEQDQNEVLYSHYWNLMELLTEGQLKYLQHLTYNDPNKVKEQLSEWELVYMESDNHPALERE